MNQKRGTPSSAAYSQLSNKIFMQLATQRSIRQLLSDFLVDAPKSELIAKFPRLLQLQKVRKAVTAFSRDIEDFSKNPFAIQAPLERILLIYRIILDTESRAINDFIVRRDAIEHAILSADYEMAEASLDEMEQEYGESIWSSRTRMLVLSALEKTEALRNLCEVRQAHGSTSINEFILKAAQFIADSGSAVLQLGAVVLSQIAELKEAKHLNVSSLLEVLFCPHPLQEDIDHLACLPFLQMYPVIDLYTILLLVLRIELAKYDISSETREQMFSFAVELSQVIDDPILRKLVNIEQIVTNGPVELAGVPSMVYADYSRGAYTDALLGFSKCNDSTDSALSLVNLAAKSLAYLDDQSPIGNTKSSLDILTKDLAIIYRLSPLWEQAEEQITSLCIKLNHFVIGPCIQLALLKALPFRYAERLQLIAARISVCSIESSTPQTYLLAKRRPYRMNKFIPFLGIPPHRQLKESILRKLEEPSLEIAKMESMLDEFKKSGALEKDVVELFVSYYMATRNDTALLRMAAEQLTLHGNRYICLPMDHLIEVIDLQQLADLDAVIMCYHYNKSVSDERASLLNETFEEYLLSTGVSKPSELLAGVTILDSKQSFFFREICIPDIMDYLGCFKTSNGLRSERIIILDRLDEMGFINPKERMREVEEIVRQVIVDAGTSEFNSAKIFVNEALIRRKHIEEVSSLISMYKDLPDGSDERYTFLDQDAPAGVYLSGGRNSLVQKIYAIIGTSYLFDDKFGLDKNLSGEIRHGFFSNLMRARLEEHNLLTELDDKGNYLPNHFWREKNTLIKDEYWEEIDKILRSFSREFDQIVGEAEEWMKISFQTANTQRMFSFAATLEEIDQMKDIVSISDEPDLIIHHIIGLLSVRTDTALTAVRERLNGEFKARIDMLFIETHDKIVVEKGGAAMLDLMSALVRVRNEIQEDIHVASLWFYKNENTEISAGTLDKLVEIAVRSFEKVRGNAYRISITIPVEFATVPVNRRVGKPFILAIINLLDNCYTHSGIRHATQVSIVGNKSGNEAIITVSNNLSSDKQEKLNAIELGAIRAKFSNGDLSMHIRGEGGTGLIKANHEITYLGRRSFLSVDRIADQFVAKIVYDFSGSPS